MQLWAYVDQNEPVCFLEELMLLYDLLYRYVGLESVILFYAVLLQLWLEGKCAVYVWVDYQDRAIFRTLVFSYVFLRISFSVKNEKLILNVWDTIKVQVNRG